ncbi:TauD-domain-containing protein [Gonapodya prolifera JEL478]|uniref:TauD-domain-containing protein n=1 Tax=Gonapodya prolifera (strain JEL478) TaxID=1344416 RepID=A0A138ZYX7_GONPJ|nr:TauD-domain-containing protein [Gonapodya prolifera JEL478]|eukprot:KXS09709.1 TauD-domain-containing protein [Gonapodya prolifera JEL478]
MATSASSSREYYPSSVPRPYTDSKLKHLAGTKADPAKKSLFSAAKQVVDYTPAIGTEIVGLQLKDLNEQQAEDLALLIAERGVVFFRDQDLTPEQQRELGLRWGNINAQVTGRGAQAQPFPFPDVQVFRTDKNSLQAPNRWHQDHSANETPASITFLMVRETPPNGGGDTVWSSLYSAYDKLSPAFRARLEGLETLQEGAYQPHDASYVPMRGTHPLIRTHPVTRWRHLYVNDSWAKQVKGFRREESDLLINFLQQHISSGVDYQVRFKWTPNSVALWDNRSTQHSAIWDFFPETRYGTRVVVHGDKSFFDPKSKSRAEALGIPITPSWRRDIANGLEDVVGRDAWVLQGFKQKPYGSL